AQPSAVVDRLAARVVYRDPQARRPADLLLIPREPSTARSLVGLEKRCGARKRRERRPAVTREDAGRRSRDRRLGKPGKAVPVVDNERLAALPAHVLRLPVDVPDNRLQPAGGELVVQAPLCLV